MSRRPISIWATLSAISTRAAVGTDIRNGAAIVTAEVPLASMFGYSTDLRSKTQGRANYSMEPHTYVELPKSLQESIIGKRGNNA